MKKGFLISCFLIVWGLAAEAQYTLQLNGSDFTIELDEQLKTATICDKSYKIDDSKYPFKYNYRKIKNFKSKNDRTIVIPEIYTTADGKDYTITTIGRAAFAGYQNIDNVIIPETVTTIEDYAFFRTSILKIEIPASVVSMGDRVFGWCTKLTELTMPQGIAMGHAVYSDSENINVKTFEKDNLTTTAQTSKKPIIKKTNKPKIIATSSDVDEDIPQRNKENDEMFAIIIANENYLNVAKVDCALNDGRTFLRYCNQTLGIPNDNIHMLEDATFGQMVEEINWLTRVAKAYEGDAKIIIYYAGHGIPNEKDGSAYLLPIDNSGNNTTAAYSLKQLYKELGALNAKNVTLFLDACFSGSQRGEGGMLTAARGVAMSYKAEDPLGNMVVFSAAQNDETAYPYAEKGHGLFTYFLLKKLKDTKGNVNYGELGDYIKKEVSRKSIVVNNKPQTPMVASSSKIGGLWRNISF